MCFSLSLLFGLFSSRWIVKDVSTDLTKSTLCCCTSALEKKVFTVKATCIHIMLFLCRLKCSNSKGERSHSSGSFGKHMEIQPLIRASGVGQTLCSYYLFIVIFSPDKKKKKKKKCSRGFKRYIFFFKLLFFSVIYFGFSEINSENHKYSVKNRHNPI